VGLHLPLIASDCALQSPHTDGVLNVTESKFMGNEAVGDSDSHPQRIGGGGSIGPLAMFSSDGSTGIAANHTPTNTYRVCP
jgi:hypothetical protein